MPELPEVEAYRSLAEAALARPVASVDAPDGWYLKRGANGGDLEKALVGRSFSAARRRGKMLLLDTESCAPDPPGPTLGLRFGMTGRLLVDGCAGVERLVFTSDRRERAWERFGLRFDDGGRLVVIDPLRLGGVELDPDEARIGPDVSTIDLAELRRALSGSDAPLKGRLLDQSKLGGVGNLMGDEILWRAGIDPRRPAGSLGANELRRLHRALRATAVALVEEGGSHTGALVPERRPAGTCPRDGRALQRARVGGRTTWWCPEHQL